MSDEFTLKDIVKEVREDVKKALEIQTRHDTLLEGILDQSKKTNGRVTSLEKAQAETTTRVSLISAGIGLVVSPIVSLIISQFLR